MGEQTTIEWADHTFNPWVGCTKVSPACDNCYAESWAKRSGSPELWEGTRRRTSAGNWRQPLKWDRDAADAGVRRRVFCASLADVFDNQVPGQWRDDLWTLIAETEHLDWLLLTKRPQNIATMLPSIAFRTVTPWGDGWPNVWLGATVENDEEARRRIPHLIAVAAHLRFLSMEPLVGAVCLWPWLVEKKIGWVITGGESGGSARPSHPDWFRQIRDDCQNCGVPFHHKQNGEFASVSEVEGPGAHFSFPDGATVRRVGKKRAGRLLDGSEHNGYPP